MCVLLTGSHRGRASEHGGRGHGAGVVRDGVNAWHGRGGEADRRHRILQWKDGWGRYKVVHSLCHMFTSSLTLWFWGEIDQIIKLKLIFINTFIHIVFPRFGFPTSPSGDGGRTSCSGGKTYSPSPRSTRTRPSFCGGFIFMTGVYAIRYLCKSNVCEWWTKSGT